MGLLTVKKRLSFGRNKQLREAFVNAGDLNEVVDEMEKFGGRTIWNRTFKKWEQLIWDSKEANSLGIMAILGILL